MSFDEDQQICVRKPKNDKVYRFQHGCHWGGFLMKLIDNESDPEYLTTERYSFYRKDPNLNYSTDPFRILQFYIEYSMDKHKRWQLRENISQVTKIKLDPTIPHDHSCYRFSCDRIFWNTGNLYSHDVSMAGSKRKIQLQKYDTLLDSWNSYDGRNRRKMLEAEKIKTDTADKTVKMKQLRVEKRAMKKAKNVPPYLHTQYVIMDFTKSLSLHNNFRPSRYIYGFYSVSYPKRQAFLERRDSGITGHFEDIESEINYEEHEDHWNSDEESEISCLARKPLTLADFVTPNLREEKHGKKRDKKNDWVFV